MWGLVQDGSITKFINNPKGLVIGDTRHSRKIFELWSKSELEAKGIYEIVFDNAKKKDEAYYINTNQTFTYDADAGTVTATYGDATAKAHADSLYTAQNESDGLGTEGEVKKAANNIHQTISSAINNMHQSDQDFDEDGLFIKDAFVDQGPTMKRFRPAAMGRAVRILKRTSNLTIIISDQKNNRG